MYTVLFDFQFANDIERATVERWTIVRITVARQLNRTRNVAELSYVR